MRRWIAGWETFVEMSGRPKLWKKISPRIISSEIFSFDKHYIIFAVPTLGALEVSTLWPIASFCTLAQIKPGRCVGGCVCVCSGSTTLNVSWGGMSSSMYIHCTSTRHKIGMGMLKPAWSKNPPFFTFHFWHVWNFPPALSSVSALEWLSPSEAPERIWLIYQKVQSQSGWDFKGKWCRSRSVDQAFLPFNTT